MTKANQARLGWSFTIQHTRDIPVLPEPGSIEKALKAHGCSRYVFQLEEGGQLGKPHYQGCCVFEKPLSGRDFRELIKSYTRKVYRKGMLTYSPTHSLNDSEVYCQKTSGRIDGPWYWPPAHERYRGQDILQLEDLYPWQRLFWELFISGESEPHPRHIHLIVDEKGNSGKSAFSKMMRYRHPKETCVVPLGLSSAQMKSALVSVGPKKVYLIDMPRNSKHLLDVLCTIEELKRGMVTTSFYGKFNELLMPRPHIMIFSNHMPKMKLLSLDMWRVHTLNEEMDTIFHSAYDIARDQSRLEPSKNQAPDVFSDNSVKYKEEDITDEIIF